MGPSRTETFIVDVCVAVVEWVLCPAPCRWREPPTHSRDGVCLHMGHGGRSGLHQRVLPQRLSKAAWCRACSCGRTRFAWRLGPVRPTRVRPGHSSSDIPLRRWMPALVDRVAAHREEVPRKLSADAGSSSSSTRRPRSHPGLLPPQALMCCCLAPATSCNALLRRTWCGPTSRRCACWTSPSGARAAPATGARHFDSQDPGAEAEWGEASGLEEFNFKGNPAALRPMAETAFPAGSGASASTGVLAGGWG